ncbi:MULTISPECIES: SPOR domain-containing protein [Yersinia]|uniref:Cell division protein DamX n=1 Tax=Yersinia intermedia TaxID=631 RepID=A0ABX6F6R4_YERIN|nr:MULTISPECIES: SPOR domain-containing protein [Yersinia]ARB82988.1 SPOR domain-containing protein [Yersinia sp. FDAARGOS_228]AVL36734.1 SPOR domain-containing protein [Yersinia intermedia]MCB5299115.1 SPOR domain-containing protein [Yersinia intermedia]MCW8113134.1 SPOR domain-containing protein [Yersinia intermedia]MDA5517982.1 SPOR domain-containing protein [Yersinia intermedia]
MDDLKPEDDLKPDSSDRRPTRARKSSAGPKLAVSRQHIMIGVGILVLLLIIIAIGSALKAPTEHEASQQNPNVDAARNINLSDSSSLTSGNNTQPGVANNASDGHDANGVKNSAQPQDISAPAISPTPTEASVPPSANSPTQRVELPGNMSDALSQTQGQVDTLSQNMNDGQTSTLPTAPATVSGSKGAKAPAPVTGETITHPSQKQAAAAAKQQPVSNHKKPTTVVSPAASAVTKSSSVGSSSTLKNAPGSHFTLQLSSASRSDTLNAYAKQQKLTDYHVYETKRDGKPWYILVSGNYPSSADAKRAITTLPADVQAKKPWVKPVQQVQQDLKK